MMDRSITDEEIRTEWGSTDKLRRDLDHAIGRIEQHLGQDIMSLESGLRYAKICMETLDKRIAIIEKAIGRQMIFNEALRTHLGHFILDTDFLLALNIKLVDANE